MTDFNQEDFNEWRDDLPRNRQLIAFQRACVAFGYPHELKEDGLGIRIDGDLEDPDFHDAVHDAFLRMYIDESLDNLVDEGKIRVSSIDDNGELCYEVA